MTPDKLIFRLKGDDEHKVFSVRMKTNICDNLDRIATQTNRSRNDVLCTLLEYALDHTVVEGVDLEP